jgi:spermidine/putrescine transport system substrate-binding protein
MRRGTLALTTILGLGLAGAPAQAADGELFLYNWTDYTSPELIEKFETETGIEVTVDSYDSNETLLAKLKSGNATYDVVVPSHNFVPILIEEGLIQKINASKLDGYKNIEKRWRDPEWDPGNKYTIPWQWGTTSFMVNTKAYDGEIDTYETLFEPPKSLQGAIGMMGSPEEVVSMALIYMDKPLCNTNPETMQKVYQLLKQQKPHVKVYNSDGIKERLLSGDTDMHMIWNGYAMRAKADKPALEYAFPKEGVVSWMDNLAVPKNAENPENAKRFIEFMMKPKNAAIQSNFARYANGIQGSGKYLDDKLKNADAFKVPQGTPTVFGKACGEKAINLQSKVWTKLLE